MDYIYDKIQDDDKAEHREIYEDFIELLLEQAPDPAPCDFYNCCWLPAFSLDYDMDYSMAETMAFSLSDKNSTHLATHLVLNYPKIYPFPANCCAPELLKITELPFTTHKSASYYSLALLCLHTLNISLDDLQGTKLFHFLERCLHINAEERVLLYLL